MAYLGLSASSPLSINLSTRACTVVLGLSSSVAISLSVILVVSHSSFMCATAGWSFASCAGLFSVGWYSGTVRCCGAGLTVSVGVVVFDRMTIKASLDI